MTMAFDQKPSWLKELSALSKTNIGDSPLFASLNTSFEAFGKLLQTAIDDSTTITIETADFKTEIKGLEFDIKNEFPKETPKEDDVYWKRHNELVDSIRKDRQEIYIKGMEIAAATIKGIINPISVSTIDFGKIFENLSKS